MDFKGADEEIQPSSPSLCQATTLFPRERQTVPQQADGIQGFTAPLQPLHHALPSCPHGSQPWPGRGPLGLDPVGGPWWDAFAFPLGDGFLHTKAMALE